MDWRIFLEPQDLSGGSVKRSHPHILNSGANHWKQRRSEGKETKEKGGDFVSKNPSHSPEWNRERRPKGAPGGRALPAIGYHKGRKGDLCKKGKTECEFLCVLRHDDPISPSECPGNQNN